MNVILYSLACALIGIIVYLGVIRYSREVERPFQILQENIGISLLVAFFILITTSINVFNITIENELLKWIYVSLVLLSFMALIILYLRFLSNQRGYANIVWVPLSLFIVILMGLLFILASIVMIDNSIQWSFYLITLYILIYSWLLVEEFRLLSGLGISRRPPVWRIVFSTMVVYVVLNIFVLICFGYYNLKFNLANFTIEPENIGIIHTLLAGGTYFFQFPQIDSVELSNTSLYSLIIQYFIGIFMNILIVPFSISYFASVVSNQHSNLEGNQAEVNLSEDA